MTTIEAINQAKGIAEGRSVIVTKQVQYTHYQAGDGTLLPAQYTISVLPGFDGDSCQAFYGKSFESCMQKLIAVAQPTSGEPNEE